MTYNTVSIANEAFPLNIGYVGAYCKERFGSRVELTLFKYIDDLENSIHSSPPDILALSNYPWNYALDLALFEMMRDIHPETLRIMGGSNISHEAKLQSDFLMENEIVDVYVYLEGEVGFSNIVERVLHDEEPNLERSFIKGTPISGCLFIDSAGKFVRGQPVPRLKALDEFPSPYLTGLMDKFFDGSLSPMMETNRGCPFSCTFCHEGHAVYQKVNFFSMERVNAELDYIAQRVPAEVHNLMFCDPNFGMYGRDKDICKTVAGIQKKTGWPKDIFASTGKNKKDHIADALFELNGSMQMWLSVQSMDDDVLDNIKRTNISLPDMLQIQSTLSANKLPSKSEIIVALPGETYETHIRSISKLVTAGVDTITAYTLMLLNGTDMNTPQQRDQWGFVGKFRVLPRDFGKLSNGKNVVEVEEVVAATKDLSFEDYVELRRLHLIISTIYNGKGYAGLFKFFRQSELDVFLLLEGMLQNFSRAPIAVRESVADFEKETRDELWDSEEDLRTFYSDDHNYDSLVSGDLGANLLQKYVAAFLMEASDDWLRYSFTVARDIVEKQLGDDESMRILENIERYSGARTRNIFVENRLDVIPTISLEYDVEAWIMDENSKLIDEFQYQEPQIVRFLFTREQYSIMEDYIQRFGNTHQGIGKILTKMNINSVWRKCVYSEEAKWAEDEDAPEIYYSLIDEQASGGVIARR
ncbi:MAG: radical SAM protein [Chloroflexota bacterium]|nr:radical SAM protein [Chloroflexota bacterium]